MVYSSMPDLGSIVLFSLNEQRYALPSAVLDRAIRAVALTVLPKAPPIVAGIINLHGRIVPVMDLRTLLRLPAREMKCSDFMLIARTSRRTVALLADAVIGMRDCPETEISKAETTLPLADHLQGVAKLEDGLVLIYDLDSFLSLDEERALDKALAEKGK